METKVIGVRVQYLDLTDIVTYRFTCDQPQVMVGLGLLTSWYRLGL